MSKTMTNALKQVESDRHKQGHAVRVSVAVSVAFFILGSIAADGGKGLKFALIILQEANSFLEHAKVKIGVIPIGVLDFFGCVLACRKYRLSIKERKSVVESLISCSLMKYGGKALLGMLMGQKPSWILSNISSPALVLAYWLTYCCPGDVYWRYTAQNRYIQWILQLGCVINVAHSITARGVDKAYMNLFHESGSGIGQISFTCIAAGVLSGAGSGLVVDWLGILRKGSPSFTVSSISNIFMISDHHVSAKVVRCFILSALYYALVMMGDCDAPWLEGEGGGGPLTRTSAKTTIVALLVTNFLLSAEDPKLDVFCHIMNGFKKALMIPDYVEGDGAPSAQLCKQLENSHPSQQDSVDWKVTGSSVSRPVEVVSDTNSDPEERNIKEERDTNSSKSMELSEGKAKSTGMPEYPQEDTEITSVKSQHDYMNGVDSTTIKSKTRRRSCARARRQSDAE
jgi:hypothetical protein